uniref:NADH-ubiquinone oxidoreductase chain 4L n=1 Tax=Apoderinae sp. 2 AV-2018 TaxID=2480750 RepID=A0A3G2JZB7_9CUCU|nr:NADH dehydrogenase subunit 4L [Apoderinae sp. 2 AV-2018]
MLVLAFVLIYLSGIVSYSLKRKHLLLMLISLEFSVLGLYLGLYSYFSMISCDFYFMMVFLTMSVCEGALGLAVLVLMVRTHGNDYISSYVSLW